MFTLKFPINPLNNWEICSTAFTINAIIYCKENNNATAINQLINLSLYFALSFELELTIIFIPIYIRIDNNATIAINLSILYHDAITFRIFAHVVDSSVTVLKKFIFKKSIFPANISSGE